MRNILLTGADGQIGWELQRSLTDLGRLFAYDRTQLDLARPDSIVQVMREIKPDIVVNAGAYTAVDQAETEKELAMQINGTAPGILAEEARRLGSILIHYSTDYIFDGSSRKPYSEDDTPNPLNAYGASKLAGETAIEKAGGNYLILRTSWVYGIRGKNFLMTMLKLAEEKKKLKVFLKTLKLMQQKIILPFFTSGSFLENNQRAKRESLNLS